MPCFLMKFSSNSCEKPSWSGVLSEIPDATQYDIKALIGFLQLTILAIHVFLVNFDMLVKSVITLQRSLRKQPIFQDATTGSPGSDV